MIKESPRVFFMDQNIKDMTSLEPFTHVYTFQIGMPEVTPRARRLACRQWTTDCASRCSRMRISLGT